MHLQPRSLATYRAVIKGRTTDSNSWESRRLWTGRLHVAHTIAAIRTVHIYCWSWRVRRWKTCSCVRLVRGCWRTVALCRSSLIIIHNCKKAEKESWLLASKVFLQTKFWECLKIEFASDFRFSVQHAKQNVREICVLLKQAWLSSQTIPSKLLRSIRYFLSFACFQKFMSKQAEKSRKTISRRRRNSSAALV